MRDGVGVRVSGAFGGHSGAGMWPSSNEARAAPVSWRCWVVEFFNCIQRFEAHGRACEAHGVLARRQVGETTAYCLSYVRIRAKHIGRIHFWRNHGRR